MLGKKLDMQPLASQPYTLPPSLQKRSVANLNQENGSAKRFSR